MFWVWLIIISCWGRSTCDFNSFSSKNNNQKQMTEYPHVFSLNSSLDCNFSHVCVLGPHNHLLALGERVNHVRNFAEIQFLKSNSFRIGISHQNHNKLAYVTELINMCQTSCKKRWTQNALGVGSFFVFWGRESYSYGHSLQCPFKQLDLSPVLKRRASTRLHLLM